MSGREELLAASDQEIADVVRLASPIVLRGLLYLLTGDEEAAATTVVPVTGGVFTAMAVTDRADIDLLRSKCAEFLRAHRDRGAEDVVIDPSRLPRSIALATGEDIPPCDVELWTEELALDPFARGLEWPEEVPDPKELGKFQVLVIGAGMLGLNAGAQLKRAGIPFTIVEKNPNVGGTWYENTYPGCRVDTLSRAYTLICGAEYTHPYAFSPQSENEKYMEWVADKYELRPSIELDTEVTSLRWDEKAALWEVHARGPSGPKTWRVNVVMTAVGLLNRPSIPTFDGQETFAGQIFHTARWPVGLDLAGKRVAVVGSGCSGYQLFPEVAQVAEHAYLFQRTPSWVFETKGYLTPLPEQVNWLERNLPYYVNFMRLRGRWLHGPVIQGRTFTRDSEVMDRIRKHRLAFLEYKLGDHPDLLEKMLPAYPPNASRPVLVDEKFSVYDALLLDNTTLVTDGIVRLTQNSIVDGAGVQHPVDIIVLATGFRANDFLWPMDVHGRGGTPVQALWEKDGARAYLGSMLPGFPNLFMIYGPNTNPVSGAGNPAIHEFTTRFALRCMAHLILSGRRTIEPTFDAYQRYNDELDAAEASKVYVGSGVRNYYSNEFGRSATNSPFDARKSWEWLRDPSGRVVASPEVSYNADSLVRPYFGHDLVME